MGGHSSCICNARRPQPKHASTCIRANRELDSFWPDRQWQLCLQVWVHVWLRLARRACRTNLGMKTVNILHQNSHLQKASLLLWLQQIPQVFPAENWPSFQQPKAWQELDLDRWGHDPESFQQTYRVHTLPRGFSPHWEGDCEPFFANAYLAQKSQIGWFGHRREWLLLGCAAIQPNPRTPSFQYPLCWPHSIAYLVQS